MRAEPELGRVQTCLGRSREAEEEKLYFPNKVVSNPCQMDPKPRNLIALCFFHLWDGGESSEWQKARFSLGIKMLCVIAWNMHQEEEKSMIPWAGSF